MRKYIGFILCLMLLPKAWATAVTATITDTDSQTWNNGAWSISLINPRPDITPNVNGVNLTSGQLSQSGAMSNSGVISVTLIDNSTISPIGTTWQFNICPNASASCGTGALAVTGSSISLSTQLSAFIKAPRFAPGSNAYGYLNAEVITSLYPGAIYYNVTSNTQQIYNKITSTWTTNGGSSGAPTTCTNTNNYPCLNTANVFTAGQTATTFVIEGGGTNVASYGLADNTLGIGNAGGDQGTLVSQGLGIFGWQHSRSDFLSASSMNYCINSQDNITSGGTDLCWYRDSAGSLTLSTSINGGPAAEVKAGIFTASSTPITTSTGQIGYGGTVTANTNCGTLVTSAGCVEVNVAGTVHYIPYY